MVHKGSKLRNGVWTATYPGAKDPKYLANKRPFAERLVIATEKRLLKNPEHANVYQEEMLDMLDRQVIEDMTKKT